MQPGRSAVDIRRADGPLFICWGNTVFAMHSEEGYRPAVVGIERKTLAHGNNTLMVEFRLQQGAVLPRHAHPHEQTGYLVSGQLRLSIGAESRDLSPGDAWCIAGGVEHGAEVLEDAVAVEVFSPLREDYLG